MSFSFFRKTFKKLAGKKPITQIEQINNAANGFRRTIQNYTGARLTRKNVGRISKAQVKKLMKTVRDEQTKTISEFKKLFGNVWF